MQPARLMVVEDDPRLSALLLELLTLEGFEVETSSRVSDASVRIMRDRPDLVLLDLTLPDGDGLDLLRQLRPGYAGPILVLTARGDAADEVMGLDLGADDYLPKPMHPDRLLARVRALLRRRPPTTQEVVEVDEVRVDPASRTVDVRGRPIELTTAEFDLLWYLARRAGEIVDRDTLYRDLRGCAYDGVDRSMDLRISRLRRLMGDDPRSPRWIKTVRGAGYLFAVPG